MLENSKKWLFFILPSSITAEGLHIVLPLYTLFLGGNVADVGIVLGLHYAASSFGAVFWGKIIDIYHVKRAILFASFSMLTVCCIWIYFTTELSLIFVISFIMGFFIIAKNPVVHLLVMESVPNNQWSKLFARTSVIASFGSLVAFLVGSMWESFFDLRPYFLFCAATSGIAVILSIGVGSRSFLERYTLVHSIYGIRHVFNYNRFHFQLIFPKIPKFYDFKHLISIFRGKITHEIGILFLTNLIFYFGSSIYFAAFIPFLKKFNFSDSSVFLVYLIQTLTLLTIFFLVPRLISKIKEERAANISYIPRVLGVLVAMILIPITFGFHSFVVAVISSSLMVAAFSIFSTANSLILFKTIPKRFEGTYLGVNSFMIGIGIFGGSITSGFVTVISDYYVSFIISVVCIMMSFVLFQFYLKYRLSHKLF
jgi:MFS family permease